ncbi:MmgE/PrpD family protein [Pantoea sp. App145]|uniref:MmgE/PrpD family protein n=1 Tax=Pantoea sp. App145 TaxID=3071567 RepID=UPI003A7FBA42
MSHRGRPDSQILGFGQRTGVASAALANGLMAHALEYDDTHNETLVHASVISVTTALAAGARQHATGKDIVTAIAGGNELSCRLGVVAPGVLLENGYHPTAVIGIFGATYLTCKLLNLSPELTTNAVGLTGSMTSGSMACWTDNTHAKTMHPGWAAHSGIIAALLAQEGLTGPGGIFEGHWGFFSSHVQQPDYSLQFSRLMADIGEEWESRNLSFKPYPVGHVSHPFLDAILYLRQHENLRAADVQRITCIVHPDWIPVVCEPAEEKLHPKSAWHGRISLQYTLAEALYHGRLDIHSYSTTSLTNPDILALAKRIIIESDPLPTSRRQFKGWVSVDTRQGKHLERIEEFNRGSHENPMTQNEIVQKFRVNTQEIISEASANSIIDAVMNIEKCNDINDIMQLIP